MMHNNQMTLFKNYAEDFFGSSDRVLEIGPNLDNVSIVGKTKVWDTAGIEDDQRLTYHMTEYEIPCRDGLYDVVYSSNVLEHVQKPWVWMRELVRVCAPGGRVITLVPANWPYHEAPVDCWRVYPNGLKALMEDAGLVVALAICCRSSRTWTRPERMSWPWFVFPWWGGTRDWCTVVDTLGVGIKPDA